MFVYLAGPMMPLNGFTLEQNIDEAAAIYYTLIQAGVNAFCPHLCALHRLCDIVGYERWMSYDFAIIDLSTHVFMLPRWESSAGAVREHSYAQLHGKTIVYRMEDVMEPTIFEKRQEDQRLRTAARETAQRLYPSVKVSPESHVQPTEDGFVVECTVWVPKSEL